MTRPKGVKSKRVNRAHARTGTRSCTGSYHDYVTHKHRSGTREEGLVFVWCEETRERRLSLLNVNVFVSQPRYCISRNGSHWRNLEGSFPFHVSRLVSEYEEYISYGIKKRKNYLVTYVDRISDWYFWQNSFHKFTYESSFAWETFSFALQLYLRTYVLFSKQFSRTENIEPLSRTQDLELRTLSSFYFSIYFIYFYILFYILSKMIT